MGESSREEKELGQGKRFPEKVPLMACAAYRTVSATAAQVLSGNPLMKLLAEEKRRLMEHRYGHQPGVQRQTRKRIVAVWQERWRRSNNTHWTRRLVPDKILGERTTPERIMRHLIDKPNKWKKEARIISDIMEAKEREDRENQNEDRNEEKD
ncbi:hypothetical protein HHI36_017199 [Cryptolaemus montrouzieri]|uniref:Uncharacterized protein n=1 Tax=Cryptolaemus montrouzieri TaxID=559131 RepID=A0ABD2NLV9_9CUCU